ncbi:glutathione S-transferase [Conidiobolus coronatus NRRL 28638]|uniref:Glutathione S-transferase n=1 Tax=Conidiobolus coronatus (strain ATCC 28846 / CBS 209.66 / NRRL 28638) TaxID=796925 RepID=A0A137P764_CONC2|nr:glutathione S-transferase [Conidiobolus coronatus NRRL 28638]|eukprot:KXN70842.1 glutathione S-transferase [Conidiobolus coronatus NRRL 28638]
MTAQSIGKLYGPLAAPKVMKITLIAAINGLELETVPEFNIPTDTKTPEYLAKFPMGQSPGFESKDGFCLSESSAIALHVAELKKDTTLFGKTAEDRSKVYQYVFNNETQVDKHASTILYPILGYMKHNQDNEDLAYTFLDRNLAFYNNELATKEYLVADQLTLADIFFFFSIAGPYKYFLSEERKTKFANVTKYFERLSQDEKFAKVLAHAK